MLNLLRFFRSPARDQGSAVKTRSEIESVASKNNGANRYPFAETDSTYPLPEVTSSTLKYPNVLVVALLTTPSEPVKETLAPRIPRPLAASTRPLSSIGAAVDTHGPKPAEQSPVGRDAARRSPDDNEAESKECCVNNDPVAAP